MHRCIYGIVHPDDHNELKVVLENTLNDSCLKLAKQVTNHAPKSYKNT